MTESDPRAVTVHPADELALLRDGATLVSTARGRLVGTLMHEVSPDDLARIA
ncbi:MAG: hypothetical protein QM604_10860 [Microbacterium sp.]